ncbi:hypothetical protein CALCODRAFT_418775, partial [Calocera cornea HHB12733]
MVPVILGPSLPRCDRSLEEKNQWCRAVLILFKPWRTLGDLRLLGETWEQAYDRTDFGEKHLQTIKNIGVLNECRDAR